MKQIQKFDTFLIILIFLFVVENFYVILSFDDNLLLIFFFIVSFINLAILYYFFHKNKDKLDKTYEEDRIKTKTILNSLNEFVFLLDKENICIHINTKLLNFLGILESEVVGKPIFTVDVHLFNILEVFNVKEKFLLPYKTDNGNFILEVERIELEIGENNIGTLCLIENVTSKHEFEKQLNLVSKVFSNCGEGIIISDANFNILQTNEAFKEMVSCENLIGKNISTIEMYDYATEESFIEQLKNEFYWKNEVLIKKETGNNFLAAILTMSIVRDNEGAILNYIFFITDISEQKNAEKRLYKLAHHDFLTGLYNRISITEKTQHLILKYKKNQEKFALLFIDLDKFKPINDNFGHKAGDKVLKGVAERILNTISKFGKENVAARLGGDEFIIIIKNHDISTVLNIASNLIKEISKPYYDNDVELVVTPSIGIAFCPIHGEDFDTLLKNADIAMYKAKESGRANFKVFNESMVQEIKDIYENDLAETKKLIKEIETKENELLK